MINEDDIKGEENSPDNEPDENIPVPPESTEQTGGTGEENKPDEEPQREEPPREKPEPVKRLYRSNINRIFLGVCGGLGEYFSIDPIIIRILFIMSFFFGIWGTVIYIFAAMLIPPNPLPANVNPEEKYSSQKENTRIIAGSSLILLGIFILLKNTGIWYYNFFGIGREIFIPIVLILAGIYLIIRFGSINGKSSTDESVDETGKEKEKQNSKKLYRSSTNRKLAGVCGGLGEYLNIDPNLIRVFWLIFAFCSFGIGILIYVIFVIFVPEYSSGIVNE